MSSDSGGKQRVQFRAPRSLVEQADALATVLETDRTAVIVSALRDHLRETTHDDELKQEIASAYYEDELSFEELTGLVGHEEAGNFRVLKQQLSDEFADAAAEELVE